MNEESEDNSETPQNIMKTPQPLLSVPVRSSEDSVQVFCRLRPLQEERQPSCFKLLSPTTLNLVTESKFARKEYNYIFRRIFTANASQREVFEHIALPLLEGLIRGQNGLIFAYGVTGSGKTYTLTGEHSLPGVMPQCINTLFNSIEALQTQKFLIRSDRLNGFEVQTESDALQDQLLETKFGKRPRVIRRGGGDSRSLYANDGIRLAGVNPSSLYAIFVSYTEIYNNTVYDLLDESTGRVLQAKIIREDAQKNMYVNGVVEVEVKSAAETFELFYFGQKRKRMAHTALNAESSRSHSIFNIRVVQLERPAQSLQVGQLSLVDLAGSERCSRSQTRGARLREASSINNSLMTLRTCLEVLRENQLTGASRLVPYRDSRLTLLFKNYFEGEGQVRMIVCVNPCNQDCEENLQVLKFAEMAQDVKVLQPESRYTPYRKTPKPNKELARNPQHSKVEKNQVFSFGPKIPTVCLIMEDPDKNYAVLDSLVRVLYARKLKAETNRREFLKKEERFRRRLAQLNQDSVLSRSEVHSLKALVKKEQRTADGLSTRVADLEATNASLANSNEQLQDIIRTLHNTIDEKNLKLNQNHLEREKAKQKLALQSQKMSQQLDVKLRRQRQHLQAALQAKDAQLQKVREILETEATSLGNLDLPEPEVDYDVVESEPAPPVLKPVSPIRQQLPAALQRVPPVLEPAVAAPWPDLPNSVAVTSPRQRRSLSNEVWLEHNVVQPVPLGTILQPSMKKRKSVSRLKKAADVTHPKQNRYCLLAQEADMDGDVQTKLYKADIVPTCGGGAQVIFNDVECVRQEPPIPSPSIPSRN